MPIHTPAAPATSAAAIPRPVAMPPAATTGRSVSVSTSCSKRQGGPPPGVPAGLGALGDDDVDPGVERAMDVGGRVDLGADGDPRVVQRSHVGRRIAEGHRHEAGRAAIVASSRSGRVSSTQIISPTPNGTSASAGIAHCSVTKSAVWPR